MNIDWSKAPEGFPVWLEDVRPLMEGADRSCWAREGKGEYELHSGGWWSYSARGTQYITHERTEWAGEGLPPVGTVCEWHGPNSDGPNGWVYTESKVVAYTDDGLFVCMQAPSCWPVVQRIDNCEFRPIRTPEQIAMAERQSAIKEMIGHIGGSRRCEAEVLYDAGYRKQVTP